MFGVTLAIVASLLWGTSDFVGGTVSRRLDAIDVVAGSQAIAVAGLVLVVFATGSTTAPLGYLPWGLAAGVAGMLALATFYRALAEGTMGVVAPIAATSVLIPVAVGLAQGNRPAVVQLCGIAVAVVGVAAAGGPDLRAGRSAVRPVLMALVAAAGFGVVIVCLAEGSKTSVPMTLLVMRLTSVGCLLATTAALRRRPRIAPADLPALAVVGGFDLAANAAFAVASRHGEVSLVAVLSSLYPVVTVILARQIHAERLTATQKVGVVAALCGAALIATAGGA